jgi:hypothetical protein
MQAEAARIPSGDSGRIACSASASFRQSGPGIVTDAALVVVKIDVGEFRLYPILERLGVEGHGGRIGSGSGMTLTAAEPPRTVRDEFIGRRLRRQLSAQARILQEGALLYRT